VVVD
jgi:hypothetical protein